MTDSAIYARQETLGIVRDQTVLVVGCGGVGAWVGYFLGLAGVERLHLFDSDDVSESNLNRLPFTPQRIGEPKSLALAELIQSVRPTVKVSAYANFDPEYHKALMVNADAVVVSTDSLKSRRMVYEAAKAAGIHSGRRYYELGADGHGMSVSGEPADWASPLEAEPGYQSVPVWVGPCTAAASVACYYILAGKPLNDTIRMDWDVKEGLRINQYQGV